MDTTLLYIEIFIAIASAIGIVVAIIHIKHLHEITSTIIKENQENFLNTLTANHQQRRNEVALELWDFWDKAFDSTSRNFILTALKWIECERNIELRNLWVSFFAEGSRVNRETFNNANTAGKRPKLILSLFNEGKECPDSANCSDCLDKDKCNIIPSDLEKIRSALITCLDVMEKVAVAYQFEIGSKDIIEKAFKKSITDMTRELEGFIDAVRKVKNDPEAWKILTDLAFYGAWRPSQENVETSRAAPDKLVIARLKESTR